MRPTITFKASEWRDADSHFPQVFVGGCATWTSRRPRSGLPMCSQLRDEARDSLTGMGYLVPTMTNEASMPQQRGDNINARLVAGRSSGLQCGGRGTPCETLMENEERGLVSRACLSATMLLHSVTILAAPCMVEQLAKMIGAQCRRRFGADSLDDFFTVRRDCSVAGGPGGGRS